MSFPALAFAVIKLSAFSRFCAVECGVDGVEVLRIHFVSGKSEAFPSNQFLKKPTH